MALINSGIFMPESQFLLLLVIGIVILGSNVAGFALLHSVIRTIHVEQSEVIRNNTSVMNSLVSEFGSVKRELAMLRETEEVANRIGFLEESVNQLSTRLRSYESN